MVLLSSKNTIACAKLQISKKVVTCRNTYFQTDYKKETNKPY